MADTGRPLTLNADVTKQIVTLLKAGNTRRAAAESAGVSKTRFYAWLAQGELDDEGEFRDFRDAVMRAESEAEVFMVDSIRRAARGYEAIEREIVTLPSGETREVEKRKHIFKPELAMEWLRRRRPDDWSETKRLEHSGPNGAPIQSVSVTVSSETLDEANRQLAEWRQQMNAELSNVGKGEQ